MAPELNAVEEAMLRPWQWGLADCCTGACDAFAALHGVDPMAVLRGRYDSAMSAARVIAAEGGFAAMVARLATAAALTETTGDEPGAIGIVRASPRMGQLGLCVGPRAWAVKSRRGYAVAPRVERGWTWRPR